MADNMKPPVAKSRLHPELRARVLELRRTHSAADVARQTGLPVGTVKAVLRYLVDQDMRDDDDPILENLIG